MLKVFGHGLLILILTLIAGCTSNPTHTNTDIDSGWVGKWQAEWRTAPEAFPEMEGIESFSMSGNITFKTDSSVQIAAFGYPGCIFSSDTLEHQLTWHIKSDTLNLRGLDDPYGIPYNIREFTANKVELSLMGDITLTLTR